MEFAEMEDRVAQLLVAKGWAQERLTFGECIALVMTELGEALDTFRKRGDEPYTTPEGKPDDIGSELADVLIRLLHTSMYFGVDLEYEFLRKMDYNWGREFQHGGKTLSDKNEAFRIKQANNLLTNWMNKP